jgi:hypothetical protein
MRWSMNHAVFWGHAKVAGNFVAADPVLAIHHQPNGGKPFGERDGTILEDSPDLDRELITAVPALPTALGLEIAVLALAAALRANLLARGPTDIGEEGQGHVLVSEVGNGFQQGFGGVGVFAGGHSSIPVVGLGTPYDSRIAA